MRSRVRVAVLAVALLACGKTDKPSTANPPPAGAPKAAATPAQAPVTSREKVGPGHVAVPGLGISVDVPAGVRFRDMGTSGKPRMAIDLGDSSVNLVSGETAIPTLDATKAALQAAANPLDKITVERMTEGGWHVEYIALGRVDKNKLHGVEVHATLGGIPYQCSAVSRDSTEAAMYAKVCDSMSKP